jgi:hypothetical protein
MLDHLPVAGLSALLVMALVAIFFVSGADAASMVMGTLSQSGSLFPSRWAVAFWGLSTGAVAVLMLWAGGNDALNGLQTMTIIVAAPFVVVMIRWRVAVPDVTRSTGRHLRRKAPDKVKSRVVGACLEPGNCVPPPRAEAGTRPSNRLTQLSAIPRVLPRRCELNTSLPVSTHHGASARFRDATPVC